MISSLSAAFVVAFTLRLCGADYTIILVLKITVTGIWTIHMLNWSS